MNNKPILTLLLLLLTHTNASIAQGHPPAREPHLYIGMGLGLDYGGLGAKFEYQPIKWVGISAGVGFNFQSYGLNAGASFYPLPPIQGCSPSPLCFTATMQQSL